MDSVTLSTDDISSTFSSGLNRLKENAWIKQSVLLERAYFLGLYNGLKSLVVQKGLEVFFYRDLDSIGPKALWGAIWTRSVDDTFGQTEVGKLFSVLRLGRCEDMVDRDDLLQLETKVKNLDAVWRNSIVDATHLLDVKSLCFPEGRVNALEEVLRLLSLIETNHLISARYK